MIRSADARFSASIMIRVSITQVLMPAPQDWTTNASAPRTDSSKRTKISPLANS